MDEFVIIYELKINNINLNLILINMNYVNYINEELEFLNSLEGK